MHRSLLACLSLVLAGCNDPADIDGPAAPAIDAVSVAPGPHNVLSAQVFVRVRNVDSAAVRFQPAGSQSSMASVTPAFPTTGESTVIPVLGLLPARSYELRVTAWRARASTTSEPIAFRTDSLPWDLPAYTASGTNPTPGYVVFAAGAYGLVIDNTGRVVWYRRFAGGPGLNFMAQPNGRYLARPSTPDPTDYEPWIELDVLGNVTRTFGCARNLSSRFHDVIVEPRGGYWIMCDETRVIDLRVYGGVASARVLGTAVQHLDADGQLSFNWSPFDHFAITDLDPAERMSVNVNWTHGNAIDLDTDGNLIVSFRSLGEITKIDTRTGAVIWRLGGLRNEFTFSGSTAPAFSRQHGARANAPGSLLLLDNTGNPGESRAERYLINEFTRSARLIRSYGSSPAVVTETGGSVQDLPGERTLVSFGTAGRVEEYDAASRVVWRIVGNAGYVFRAQRITSLYAPGVGTLR